MTLQEEIIAYEGVKPLIDPQEEIRKSIDFLKSYMLKHPFLKTYVLGISGGQDSTLAGRLTQLAMEELRADTGDTDYQFIAVRLPYGIQADEADAQRALDFIQPDIRLTVNIKPAVEGQVAELAVRHPDQFHQAAEDPVADQEEPGYGHGRPRTA